MPAALVDSSLLVRDATSLEPLPPSATRLAVLIARPERDMQAIIEAVRLDQALTGRILGAANSVISGTRQEITSVDQAVLRMGPGLLLSFVIGSCVKGRMQEALPAYGLSEGELWRHSVCSALAIERAREHCKRPAPPHGFATALLHDIGKLVLARHLDERAVRRIREAQELYGMGLEEAEREVLHVCHARVGAMVARCWRLPDSISAGILYHHRPLNAPTGEGRQLCQQLVLADAVATRTVTCSTDSRQRMEFDGSLAGSLGITRQGFEELCGSVEHDLEQTLAAYA